MARQGISRYAYWSDRRARSVADDFNVGLSTKLKFTFIGPKIPYWPEFEVASETRTLRRAEIAAKIENRIGKAAAVDMATPARIQFAKGLGRVSFSRFVGVPGFANAAVMHTTGYSSTGTQVEICLFGSLDNFAGFTGAADPTPSGWSSSAAYAVGEYVQSRGARNTSQWDDDESIAVEALTIATNQGDNFEWHKNPGRPELRGFTFGEAEGAEWFAEIYKDVPLTKGRWNLRQPVDRILIGAPLWIRTPTDKAMIRYRVLRQQDRRAALRRSGI